MAHHGRGGLMLLLVVTIVGLCQSESEVRPAPPKPTDQCYAKYFDFNGNEVKECSRPIDIICRGGQVLQKCGDCAPARTCENPDRNKGIICPAVCKPRCECPDTLPIWRNGRCISEKECEVPPQECKSNLVWNECGSPCTNPWRTCSNNEAFSIADREKEDSTVCPDVCMPRCECPKDAPVLYNRVCVPETSCPKEPENCDGKLQARWEANCPINPCEQHSCPSTEGAGCRPYYCGGCYANYFNEVDAPIKECSASKETCKGGQEWTECGMACLKTCSDPNPMCTKNCVPRCQCPTDKPIWKDGQCVTINDCDSSDCKGGMVFEECGSRCTRTCKDKNPTCVEVCEPKCQCPKDKPYLHKGSVCIPEEKCPEKPDPECKGGMVYQTCASKCTATCANQDPVCSEECVARCACPKTAPIFHKGGCMPANECPAVQECEGGQMWMTCGMGCTLTCDDPRPICDRECVEKCQCPPLRPIWHEGQCIPFDRCPEKPKEECVFKGKEYNVGDVWSPDPCTECFCEMNKETEEKFEICSMMDCAFPECDTELITPKDQCCPICAEPCSHKGETYDIGQKWQQDPCTTCACVETPDGKKEEKCYKIACAIPKCRTELVWDKEKCCPYCAEECTYKGRVYEIGDSWQPNDCTSCRCIEENGEKRQICAMERCMRPPPHCRPYRVPGECCPRCDETCTMYDKETNTKNKYEVGDTWKPDPCTTCTCARDAITGKVQEQCVSKACAKPECSRYEELVFKKGMCCPVCVKACYEVTTDGEFIFHKPNEPWQKSPCETCVCVPDEETVYKNICSEIMCDIPICRAPSEIVYDPEVCCPYCSDPCTFNGKNYEVGDTWKPTPCQDCTCVDDRGSKHAICSMEACAKPEKPCELVYSKDACCPKCQEPCQYYDGGETIQYQPGDKWKPDSCTFCSCQLNAAGEKEQKCAVMDCAPLDRECVPVYNKGQCCPVCEERNEEKDAADDSADKSPVPNAVCEVKPTMEHGHAVDKSGTGTDIVYTFKCDDGYWFKKGAGNKAYCNKEGQPVYPVCHKLGIETRLKEREPGTYQLEISSSDADGTRSPWGLLCDDGWSDAEAQLICKKHGYNYGRAISLESSTEDEFLFTQMSCPREDDFLLQECSVTRYADAKLPCQFNEAAGMFCYNAAFEYKIMDKIESRWSRRTIALIFDVTALKYGKPLNLRKGIFRLEPSHFTVTSDKSTSSATKSRIKFKDGVATVRMKLRRPRNFMAVNCITLSIKGPSREYDHHVQEICAKN